MKKGTYITLMTAFIFIVMCVASPWIPAQSAAAVTKELILDEANLLNSQEIEDLNTLANKYSAERETDLIVLTTNNEEQLTDELVTENFYDEQAPGYDKPHGNAVILTLDMYNRNVYVGGFYKGEDYVTNSRADEITAQIAPDLSDANYSQAFEKYLTMAYEYLGDKPLDEDSGTGSTYPGSNSGSNSGSSSGNYPSGGSNANPDHILFNTWFQLAVSVVIGGIVVGIMAYNSGGRVTVNRATYEDSGASSVVDRGDRYIRTTVTKTKIEKNNNNGGGGGGGGTTSGGHSHSGSSRSF
ncbi:TPM domain-containing protein [Paenibacillus sp. ACRSA]|uniref:TPM domain-containing protein n=1 Tax=Paenibacillus sp. ACRSA TaxID=2918211 RepID=UPI001EF5EF8D|nr:TPM domain-containing protein [Paenibacillus sp. ACRSA]MCG7379894.1 TPM domain-containing protein [Paenibacillus sp. ACRSA]